LNVKQLYKPTEGQEKYQIRKLHQLHIHILKALIRYNPCSHVVDYLFLVDPMEVLTREEFDRSKCFDYKYYVIGGNHFTEDRRELMQQYPNNPLFETVKCIIYVGLTYSESNLLAWDHNIDNEDKISMTFIQRVRFIHNEFSEIYHGERSNVDVQFWKQCCMEKGFPLDDENTKEKYHKGSDIFRDVGCYFQLGFRTRQVWDLIDDGTSKTCLDIRNLPDDMTITPWI
jgi:hypothetical protein